MQTSYLELRSRRELGTILSDSFALIRLNSKPLTTVLVQTCGVYFVLAVLFSALYQYANVESWMVNDISAFGVVFLLLMLGSILFYASASAAIYSFMQNYMETKGQVDVQAVIRTARHKTGSMILLVLITYVLLVLGFIFLLIPGIYFIVPVALAFPVFCLEDSGKLNSIKRAFNLTSGYWWVSFGTLLVIVIVIGIISFVFQLPGTVYLGGKTFFTLEEGNGEFGGDFIYLILATIGSAASNLLSIVMIVAIGLLYFDLDEEKNRTGLKAKLDDLG
jgi:hypothetical protein